MGLFKTRISPSDNSTVLYDGTEIHTVTLNSGGSGWAANDWFVVDGVATGGERAIGKVLTVNAGAVATLMIIYEGYGYTVANGLTCTKLAGNGSGLIINVTVLKTRNCYYAHASLGNDANVGTKINPFQTITKAETNISVFKLYKGSFVENVNANNTSDYTIFENESYLNGNMTFGSTYQPKIVNAKIKLVVGSQLFIEKSNVDTILFGMYGQFVLNYCFIKNIEANVRIIDKCFNNTILNYKNHFTATLEQTNNIHVFSTDLYNFMGLNAAYYPIFKYCLFRKAHLWKWNGATIPITYGTNPDNYMNDVINSLSIYATAMSDGAAKTYLQAIIAKSFFVDANLMQTNKVVDDTVYPIFNRYSGSAVIDYTLSTNSNNVALTMGNPSFEATINGKWVGCYRPNIGGQYTDNPMIFSDVLNVNTDGTDDAVTTPTLLLKDVDGAFLVNQESVQKRNRVRTNVLTFTAGKTPLGAQSSLTSSSQFNFVWGKYRAYSSTNSFQETVECIPYDSPTTLSLHPKFSIAFNGETKIWRWMSGTARAGQCVLFSQLAELGISTNINLTEFGNYAVTTADPESMALTTLRSSLVLNQSILVKYLQAELNLNYIS